jgi:beta-glucosidase
MAGPGVTISHAKGSGVREGSRAGFEEAVRVASAADLVVLVLGGTSERDFGAAFGNNGAAIVGGDPTEMDCGEGVDVAHLELGGVQNELAVALADTGKPIVTVLVQGRPYAISSVSELSRSVLCAWYPGPFGGQAIAEILFGKTNPSGRLPISIPRSSGQLPVFYNRKNTESEVRYADVKGGALYPFGFGLGYSEMRYADLKAQPSRISVGALAKGERVRISVSLSNVGRIDGDEVVQLYLRDHEASITTRLKELRGFERVSMPSGQTRTVHFSLGFEDFAIWNQAFERIVEPGRVTIYIGGDSATAALSTTIEIEI